MHGEEGRVSADLTREEAGRLLDECRDGEINEADARRLAAAICAGDDNSKWILDELELSGLISQALDTTDTETFLRGFLERLAAEKSVTEFTVVSEERIRQTAIKAAHPKPGIGQAVSLMFGHRTAETGLSTSVRRSSRGIAVAAVVLAAAAAAVVLVLCNSRQGRVAGTVMTASPGVTVDRSGSLLRAEESLRLRAGDRMQVPSDGSIVMVLKDAVWVRAASRTVLTIQPAGVPGSGEKRITGKGVHVESGDITVEVPQQDEKEAMTVFSPHAMIEALMAQFSVSVTPSSTRVEVKSGEVRFTRMSDRAVEEIGPGESGMASQAGDM